MYYVEGFFTLALAHCSCNHRCNLVNRLKKVHTDPLVQNLFKTTEPFLW